MRNIALGYIVCILVDSIRPVVMPDKHVATDWVGKKIVFSALGGLKLLPIYILVNPGRR